MNQFTLGERNFLLNGEPFQIISAGLHYFRVRPEQWADRLDKLAALGCNTVETYVPWNLHEPRPGDFDFAGGLDLGRFLDLAAERGLKAVVRPGPYICAEWDGGGLPAWLLGVKGLKIRRWNAPFLSRLEIYLQKVFQVVRSRLVTEGGPVILLQVENEYGVYGGDKRYLRYLEGFYRREAPGIPLFTSDQPVGRMLRRGSLPSLLRTANFGSRSRERLAALRRHQPWGPLMCMEFWVGWFDHWGGPHHTNPAEASAAALEELLEEGASVNIYLLQGGTNFGRKNGADYDYRRRRYKPTVTSYDYDALLTEDGRITEKYRRFQGIIRRCAQGGRGGPKDQGPAVSFPPPRRLPAQSVRMFPGPGLDELAEGMLADGGGWKRKHPAAFMDIGLAEGYLLYRRDLDAPAGGWRKTLVLPEFHDRARIFLNGNPAGAADRNGKNRRFPLVLRPGENRLEILVENRGRINYGRRTLDRKGLLGKVRLGGRVLKDWIHIPLPLAEAPDFRGEPEKEGPFREGVPRFFSGSLEVEQPADTFVDFRAWGRGDIFINGFCLGRYDSAGPQGRLYLPAPLLRSGRNELALLELEPAGACGRVALREEPLLDLSEAPRQGD